jgi:hypothetical protein
MMRRHAACVLPASRWEVEPSTSVQASTRGLPSTTTAEHCEFANPRRLEFVLQPQAVPGPLAEQRRARRLQALTIDAVISTGVVVVLIVISALTGEGYFQDRSDWLITAYRFSHDPLAAQSAYQLHTSSPGMPVSARLKSTAGT